MRYGSICSGIEAFSVAVAALPWHAKWFCEIEPFCCRLLRERYPEIPNYGDITKKHLDAFAPVDIIVGGTPCQSFSVQGHQRGMDDQRGVLSLRFCDIVASVNPRWVIWENVENAIRIGSGRPFAYIVRRLDECGYFCAWRVLDARYFGVAQRRRRVFLVASNRSWRHAGAVLFEPRTDVENTRPSRKVRAGKRVDGCAKDGVIGWSGDETPKRGLGVVPTLRASQGGEGVGVFMDGRMSRLTINEWERLQGFQDDYTKIEGATEAQRKHAIGNSFAVPVMAWIARRIAHVEHVVGGA